MLALPIPSLADPRNGQLSRDPIGLGVLALLLPVIKPLRR